MKLKPCPFCGATENDYNGPRIINKSLLGPEGYVYDYAVWCSNCGAQTDWYADEDADAVKAWNRRAGERSKK